MSSFPKTFICHAKPENRVNLHEQGWKTIKRIIRSNCVAVEYTDGTTAQYQPYDEFYIV